MRFTCWILTQIFTCLCVLMIHIYQKFSNRSCRSATWLQGLPCGPLGQLQQSSYVLLNCFCRRQVEVVILSFWHHYLNNKILLVTRNKRLTEKSLVDERSLEIKCCWQFQTQSWLFLTYFDNKDEATTVTAHLSGDFTARLVFLGTRRVLLFKKKKVNLHWNSFSNVVRHLETNFCLSVATTKTISGRNFDSRRCPPRISVQLHEFALNPPVQ